MSRYLYTAAALLLVCAAVPLALYYAARRTFTIDVFDGFAL